ncbi:MAG: hypothetical protein MUE59_06315 [Thiobacillaceae bacterium]|jgi:hypothetical protein|nr:hypothetical protein [Thiobacillaceae bacterium]
MDSIKRLPGPCSELAGCRRPAVSKLLAAALAAALLTAGCTHFGPESLRATRIDYNRAIQQTNDQELLLNLVRLRYRDTLYFLNVERVASSLEITSTMAATAELPSGAANTFTLGEASYSFMENPTVFYLPLEGEKFVRQMMTPFNLNLLVLLTTSGWSVERVFTVMLREINGIKNAPSASGPTPSEAPEYRTFQEAMQLLRAIQKRDGFDLGRIPDDESALELRFARGESGSTEARRLRELLGLNPDLERFRLRLGIGRIDDATITILPRSMVSSLSYLSQSVQVPKDHEAAGIVTLTLGKNDEPFDWNLVFDNVMRIRTAPSAPQNAAIAVPYRGHWFYIDDRDLGAKSTFALLSQLFALQAGTQQGSNLQLSFPVGR